MTQIELAVRGATVVDGTGRPPFRADLGIAEGRIAEISDRVHGDKEIDASGRHVFPGFVDIHTHYDAQALWDPELSPSSWQGVTTAVCGNCGFSLAPVRPQDRVVLLEILEKVEDMHLATMRAGIEWDFETYPQYLDALARRQPAINVGGYVGHSAVRVYAMGRAASERTATSEELDRMRRLVADSLRGGALGFSTDRAGFILGAAGRPVPSVVASQEEVESLMGVPGEVGQGIVHIAPGDDYRWLYERAPGMGTAINWSSILAYPSGSTTRTPHQEKLAHQAQAADLGADVWAQVTCRPINQSVTLADPTPLSTVPAFAEVFELPRHRRSQCYVDSTWRSRAQRDLEASSVPLQWESITLAETASHPDLVGCSIGSIARSTGRRPLDVLCDLALDDGLEARFSVTFANGDPEAVRQLLDGHQCVLGLSDAGAHVSQICDAVMPTDFLSRWVRDREVMPLEHGVRKLTGELADLLEIDRGYLEVGRPADMVVMDYAALDPGPIRRVRDMPAGGERLVADAPAGIEAVVVNGVPIRLHDEVVVADLERRPGQVVRSGVAGTARRPARA